jgi:hypothetical protein
MHLARKIVGFLLVLGIALGSAVSVVSATERAFAVPCPMHDQGDDCPCCKGDCTPAMMGCSTHCSIPFNAADITHFGKFIGVASEQLKSANDAIYDPFVMRPPPPIPIA